ncbi:acetoin utilization protein AcuB [Proteiniborus sp. DW1]|uniref:CBS domain-containing protein n=1 Tax=Proteiniborus sp. DW1 TaxID=1889883 RepID=UPI00092E0EBA|nr:CBS domain-containing protein [Proteiniborus sp. DW1]SCG83564.1 acetoin utilization protein AcuB [Proteiniborus sp. DW1]
MYVKNHVLSKDKLVMLQIEDSISEALDKIIKGDFLSLPVLDGDKFVGILMKETIFRHYFEEGYTDKEKYLKETKVKDLYKSDVKTINENVYIEKASYLLNEFRTPFLPVLNDKGDFKGILTHSSIFNAFSEIFGLNRGTKILINVYDIPGQIAKLTETIRKANVNIANFAVMDAKVMDVYQVVVRVDITEVDELIEKIEKAGFKIAEINN